MSDFYEYMSDPSHGDMEDVDTIDLYEWPTPDDLRTVSQFDTVEEDRGER